MLSWNARWIAWGFEHLLFCQRADDPHGLRLAIRGGLGYGGNEEYILRFLTDFRI